VYVPIWLMIAVVALVGIVGITIGMILVIDEKQSAPTTPVKWVDWRIRSTDNGTVMVKLMPEDDEVAPAVLELQIPDAVKLTQGLQFQIQESYANYARSWPKGVA
jgi:hypothetical protein